jgi:hypothetical protein
MRSLRSNQFTPLMLVWPGNCPVTTLVRLGMVTDGMLATAWRTRRPRSTKYFLKAGNSPESSILLKISPLTPSIRKIIAPVVCEPLGNEKSISYVSAGPLAAGMPHPTRTSESGRAVSKQRRMDIGSLTASSVAAGGQRNDAPTA